MCQPPSAPPGPEPTLMPDPGPGEVSATVAAPPPALPEFIEPPFGQAPILVTEASGQHFRIRLQLNRPTYTCLSRLVLTGRGKETPESNRGCAPLRSQRRGPTTNAPNSYSSLRFRGQMATTISAFPTTVAYYYQIRLMETIFRTHCLT